MDEDEPERFFPRAQELGVLTKLYPSIKGDSWLSEKFCKTRSLYKRISPAPVYFCLLIYNMAEKENEQSISRLNMPKGLAEAMRHTLKLKKELQKLGKPNLKPSDIYQLLCSYTTQSIRANAVATDSSIVSQRLQLYLNKLSYVKPLLDGDDLQKMGVPPGQLMGKILKALHRARLNGEIKTREDEERLVRSWHNRTIDI